MLPIFFVSRVISSDTIGVMVREISPTSSTKGTMPMVIPERMLEVPTVKVTTGFVPWRVVLSI